MRKTKIVCTLGPSTDNEDVLRQLMLEGMNVARCNFSHGVYEEHKKRMDMVKKLRKEVKKPIAILLDTKGPEVRVKQFKDGKVTLKEDQLFTLTSEEVEGTQDKVSVTYNRLYEDLEVGMKVLIDDGLIEMRVEKVEQTSIVCRVLNGGTVSNNKGINVPDVNLSMPYVSEKDREDILFGISQDVDFIAASFVQNKEDILQLRRLLDKNGGEDIKIIAKIENAQGVENIDEIIEVSDGIMIARGDMGVEIPYEEVPVIQKMIIKKVYQLGKQVITATQMLESMVKNPRPTRAEATDIANAVYDGTSAIMLSGETAAGAYPVEAVKTMVRIAERTEQDVDYRKRFFHHDRKANPDITDAICHATCTTAHDLNAKAIVTVTKSGRSARMISGYRPASGIIGCATSEKVCRQINLAWGVTPILIKEEKDVYDLFDNALRAAEKMHLLEKGDLTVITSGVPIGISGTTNMIKVQNV
ncbi:MAG: pyruvate kinase [Bacillus sp. (in: Bacteria)]|nr:pyruvate kinase [Bacillus sp. (in: firmicutes)]MCM1425048.1 pyruvate kinase [Eubacterium sp.]